ncbi:glycosyltransferase family 4 protein [Micromonospora zamorensis]|uniref:glycosyltransferase family 4 protein n=1 Tax=Micromonospora zamorensis TaxID=709883 RepID=UPI003D994A1A
MAKTTYGVPHVVTAHSLEPCRPWKAQQPGGGYALSSFYERTAPSGADRVIAVSSAMRADLLRHYPELPEERISVVHNGVDGTRFAPTDRSDLLSA